MQNATPYILGILEITIHFGQLVVVGLFQFIMPFLAVYCVGFTLATALMAAGIRGVGVVEAEFLRTLQSGEVLIALFSEVPLRRSAQWEVMSWMPLLLCNALSIAVCRYCCKCIRTPSVPHAKSVTRWALTYIAVVGLWDAFSLTYKLPDSVPSPDSSVVGFLKAGCVERWAELLYAIACTTIDDFLPAQQRYLRYRWRIASLKAIPALTYAAACFWWIPVDVSPVGRLAVMNSLISLYMALRQMFLKKIVLRGPLSPHPTTRAVIWNYITGGVLVYGWHTSKDEDRECPICLEPLNRPPQGTKSITLVCGHSLHECCAVDCVQKLQLCPMCKVWPGRKQALHMILNHPRSVHLNAEADPTGGLPGELLDTLVHLHDTQFDSAQPPNQFEYRAFADYLDAEFGISDAVFYPQPCALQSAMPEASQCLPLVQPPRRRGKRQREDYPMRVVVGPARVLGTRPLLPTKRGKRTVRDEPDHASNKKSRTESNEVA